MKKHIIFLFLLFCVKIVFAQSNETKITFSIDKQDFKSPLPFDEAFKLIFESDKKIEAIEIKYRIKGLVKDKNNCANFPTLPLLDKDKYYHQYEKADDCGYITKSVTKVQSKNFSIGDFGLLHPNTPYEFVFNVFTSASVNEKQLEALKKQLLKEIKRLYLGESLPSPNQIKSGIQNIIQKNVSNELYDANGKKLNIRNTIISDLPNLISNLQAYDNDLKTSISNYNQNSSDLKNTLDINFRKHFLTVIELIDENSLKDKKSLSLPINSLLPTYSKVSLQEVLAFFKLDFSRNNIYIFYS